MIDMLRVLVEIEDKAIELSRDIKTGEINLDKAKNIADYVRDRLNIKLPNLPVN